MCTDARRSAPLDFWLEARFFDFDSAFFGLFKEEGSKTSEGTVVLFGPSAAFSCTRIAPSALYANFIFDHEVTMQASWEAEGPQMLPPRENELAREESAEVIF